MALIECIPNVSDGRRAELIERIASAVSVTPGVRLLDHSSDPSHNRSGFTFAGNTDGVERALMAVFDVAVANIDLRSHKGEHPRLGAVDVVPFVPIEGVTMADCVALAFGHRAAGAFDIRPGARMTAIEKQRARPDIDGLLILRREVVVEAGEQQLFDLRVAINSGRIVVRGRHVAA